MKDIHILNSFCMYKKKEHKKKEFNWGLYTFISQEQKSSIEVQHIDVKQNYFEKMRPNVVVTFGGSIRIHATSYSPYICGVYLTFKTSHWR